MLHDKLLRRFVWFIGLVFLIAGFVTLLTGIPSFLFSIVLLLGMVAIYALERRFVGSIGHIGFFLSSLGAMLAFNLASMVLDNIQAIIFLWVFIAIFAIGCILFAISTIRTGFVPTEVGFLLLSTPAIAFLPLAIKRFAFALFFLAIGYFLMLFVSRNGKYDTKLASQQGHGLR